MFCSPYFWEQPSILFSFPLKSEKNCVSNNVNEIAIVYIVAFILSALLMPLITEKKASYPVPILLATVYLIPIFQRISGVEGFVAAAANETKKVVATEPFTATMENATLPTARNPFMNVLVDEVKYNPLRPEASDVQTPQVSDTLDAFFRVQQTSDPTDIFGKSQSQRQFITQPSTSIPNDMLSYRDWLYKIPGPTCKEDTKSCTKTGSNSGKLPWIQ